MSATLNLRNNFNITINGTEFTGKHGSTTDDAEDYYAITMDGAIFPVANQLATGSVRTLFDDDNQFPANWDYMFLWSDQDLYLQLIGSTGNVVLHMKAKVPFILWNDEILPAANTTLLVAGATPTMEDIDSVLISNVSGSPANYSFFLVD